jgi:hypothetical protein
MSKDRIQLIACKAISNGALKQKELPSRIKVLNWGDNDICDGSTVKLDEFSIKPFDATQKKTGRTKVAIDFNHSTVPDTKAHKEFGDKPNIFGYGVPSIIPGDGMWVEDIEWTPFGEQYARNCADISPAPLLKEGRVVGLDSVALTPNGAIDGLSFYTAEPLTGVTLAKFSSVEAYAAAVVEPSDHDADDTMCMCKACSAEKLMQFKARQLAKVQPMSAKPSVTSPKVGEVKEPPAFSGQPTSNQELSMEIKAHIAKFRAEAGMPETASDESVMDWVRAKWDTIKAKQPNLSSTSPEAELEKGNIPTNKSEPHATITYSAEDLTKAVTAAITPLTARLEKLEASKSKEPTEAERKAALISQATKDGKIVPLTAPAVIEATPYAVLEEIVKNLPVGQVPMAPKVRAFSADENKNDRTVAVQATKTAWAKAVGAK